MEDNERLIVNLVEAYAADPNELAGERLAHFLESRPADERGAAYRALLKACREQHLRLEEATSPPLRTAVVVRPGYYTPGNGRAAHGFGNGDLESALGLEGLELNGGGNGAANGHAPLALVRLLPGGAHALCAVDPDLVLGTGDMVALTTNGGAVVDRIGPYEGGDIGCVEGVKTETDELVLSGLNEEQIVVTGCSRVFEDPRLKVGAKVRYDKAVEIATRVEEEAEARSDSLASEIPDLSWSDFGGLPEVVQQLREVEESLLMSASSLARYGLPRKAVVVLSGLPGTGKTYSIKVLAASLRRRLGDDKVVMIIRRAADDLDALVGVTEKRIRGHFERIRDLASRGYFTIFIWDEIDCLLRTRSGHNTGTMVDATIPNTVLGELGGIAKIDNCLIVSATNRIDLVDRGVIRDGRFGEEIPFPLPDWESCEQILRVHLRRRESVLGDPLEEMAERAAAHIWTPQTEGCAGPPVVVARFDDGRTRAISRGDLVTGAKLEAVCETATKSAMMRAAAGGPGLVRTSDLLAAIDRSYRKYRGRITWQSLPDYVDWPLDETRRVTAIEAPAGAGNGHESVFVEVV